MDQHFNHYIIDYLVLGLITTDMEGCCLEDDIIIGMSTMELEVCCH